MKEEYNPDKPVCDNQNDFNVALRNAIKYNGKENMKNMGGWIALYLVLYLIFVLWAVFLAAKVPPGPQRTQHVLFALLFAPAYVLAYYLNRQY